MLTMQATIYSVSILLQKQLALEVQEIILEIFSSCFSEDGFRDGIETAHPRLDLFKSSRKYFVHFIWLKKSSPG